ncbi:unnamed protein product [Alopecurus aequalis]
MGSESDYDFLGGGGDEYEGGVAEWEAGLPGSDELTPLSQPLVPPGLAAAFRIPPEPGRTLLDVHRASSATVSRLRSSKSSSPSSGPNATGGSFPSFPSKGGEQDTTGATNTNNSAESAGEKAGAKRARLVWTPQLHKRFVDVVAHLGIKAAVPKTIMQLMNVEGLTRENVASHLQKYRQYVSRMHGLSSANSESDDRVFASTPVPPLPKQQVQVAAPMPPAVYHHPAPMTMGGMTGSGGGYYQQQHSGHAVYNGYGGGHAHGVYHQYHHGDR